MANNNFERVISGAISDFTLSAEVDIVIRNLSARTDDGFTLRWAEFPTDNSFTYFYEFEQDFTVDGSSDGSIRTVPPSVGATTISTFDLGIPVIWSVEETEDAASFTRFTVRQQLAPASTEDGRSSFDVSDYNKTQIQVVDGTSNDEYVRLSDRSDLYYSADERSEFRGGVDEVYGGGGFDTAVLSNRVGNEELYAGFFDGGFDTDRLRLNGVESDYTIYTHGGTLVFRHKNFEDGSGLGRMIATAKNIEIFEDTQIRDLEIMDAFAMRSRATVGQSPDDLSMIRDFDGNDLGASGDWKYIGAADAQYDNDAEYLYINQTLGRWATVGPDGNGNVDFSKNGAGGDTRVVGIYIDPEVEAGRTEKDSDFDSQRRFQNDLKIDNLTVIDAFDFDADGFQEIYFKVNDGSAYLRALMHEDGNIQYANYQSREQVDTYLTDLGYGQEVIDTILV